jgi:hypothetical protein
MFRAQSNIFDDVVVKATDENLTSENWEYILVRLPVPPRRAKMWKLAPGRLTPDCAAFRHPCALLRHFLANLSDIGCMRQGRLL